MHTLSLNDPHRTAVSIPLNAPETPAPAGPFRGAWLWVRSHKLKTVFFLLGAFLLYELLTIPFITILSLNSTNP
ncbi:MAG: hypothetical protein H6Q31_1378, partial [Bacteroidetes bacterium]|nr:hypothetical protein [Bacteroidota bacterium]